MKLSCTNMKKYVVLALLLLCTGTAFAKKEKTDNPTESPTAAPTTSIAPSLSPTTSPTEDPTSEPTLEPSTLSPTEDPTQFPTSSPTASPTSALTSAETISKDVQSSTEESDLIQSVALPSLVLDVIVNDEDGSSSVAQDLESDLSAFLEDVIQTSDGVDTLDYVVFDFDVILSSFGRRRLQSGLSIKVDGTAYYGEEFLPVPEDLTANIRTYFATWGMQDLQTYLQVIGLGSAQVVSVSVDGDKLTQNDTESGYNPGATVVNPPAPADEGSIISPGVFAGVVAVGTLCIVTLLYFLVQFCRMSTSPYDDSGWGVEDSDTVAAAAEPKQIRSNDTSEDDIGDDESLGGQSVVDDGSDNTSVYTTSEGSNVSVRENPNLYNLSRLDRVIEVARIHSDLSNEKLDV